jgi:hypothetical protein
MCRSSPFVITLPDADRAGLERRARCYPLPHAVKVITPAGFKDSDALAARLLAFQERYNATAAPSDWKFTRAKLNGLGKRIDAHRDRAGLPLAA